MKEFTISVDLLRVKKRVYRYVSKLAQRIAQDSNGFEMSALTIDDDPFFIEDNGLIDTVSLPLIKRLSVYHLWVEVKENSVSVSFEIPFHENREEEYPRYKQPKMEHFEERMTNAVEQYYYKALVSEWLELLGVIQNYPQFTPMGVQEALEVVRLTVDNVCVDKVQIRPLGF